MEKIKKILLSFGIMLIVLACVGCGENKCDNCDYMTGVCTLCDNGFKKLNKADLECISCSNNGNCTNCKQGKDENEANKVCGYCEEGWYLDSDKNE